jgi:ATP-dependent RNA helicase DeaD
VTWLARETEGEAIDLHAISIAERLAKSPGLVTAVARLIEKAGLHGPTKPRDVRTNLPAPRDPNTRPRTSTEGRPKAPPGGAGWVTFRVTWGSRQGADPRRLLAMSCRRGKIHGTDVGAIRVESAYSLVDVARGAADTFEKEVARPDTRNPEVQITREERRKAEDASTPRRPEPHENERTKARKLKRPERDLVVPVGDQPEKHPRRKPFVRKP